MKCSFRHFLFAAVPPERFVQDAGKDGEGSLGFPNDGISGVFGGSAAIGGGGGRFGGQEGRRSAVQRLAFCIVGQLGIKVLCAAE